MLKLLNLGLVAGCLLYWSCGGGAPDTSSADDPPAPPSAPLVAAKPVAEPPASCTLDSPGRLAAQTLPQVPMAFLQARLLYGAYGLEQFGGQRVSAELHRARFAPEPEPAGAAYTLYCFEMTNFQEPPQIMLDWDGATPDPHQVYLGLGEMAKDRWVWFQPEGVMLQLASLAPYTSAEQRLVLAVVLAGGPPAVLDAVRIGSGCVVEGIDLPRVFAPPLAFEIAAVRQEFAARQPASQDFAIEFESTDGDGYRYFAISHVVDGLRHYGGVRLPPAAGGDRFPVMVFGHPSTGGAGLLSGAKFDQLLDDPVISSRFIIVIPTFRGEFLFLDGTHDGLWSEGARNLYDRDSDDLIAMLDAVLQNFTEADPALVLAFGYSRGAQVVVRAAERDPRIKGVVSYCGFADEFLTGNQAYMFYVLPELPDTEPDPGDVYGHALWDLRYGSGDIWAARRSLLITSTAYLADALPRVQLHHGELDDSISCKHSLRLRDMIQSLGGNVEYYGYPEGRHDYCSEYGGGEHFRDFVQSFLAEYDAAP